MKQHVQRLAGLIQDPSIPEARRREYASKLMMASYYVMIYVQGADIDAEILAYNTLKNCKEIAIRYDEHTKFWEATIQTGASGWGIDLTPVGNTFNVMNNTLSGSPNGIIVNYGPADRYRIEGNTLFGASVVDSGTGTYKQVTGNW